MFPLEIFNLYNFLIILSFNVPLNQQEINLSLLILYILWLNIRLFRKTALLLIFQVISDFKSYFFKNDVRFVWFRCSFMIFFATHFLYLYICNNNIDNHYTNIYNYERNVLNFFIHRYFINFAYLIGALRVLENGSFHLKSKIRANKYMILKVPPD